MSGGAGLAELVTPTNGAIVAVAAGAGVALGDWLSRARRGHLTLLALTAAILIVAVAIASNENGAA